MREIKLRRHTCFGVGLAGSAMLLLCGILMLAGTGQARYAQTACLVLTGAMLLLLGAFEKGPQNKGLRLRLLLLFFALLAAHLRLPPLDYLEVLALPGLALLYRRRGDGGPIAVLVVCEAAAATARILAATGLLGARPLLVLGAALCALALARAVVLARLFARAKQQAPPEEGPQRRLR